MPVRQVAKALVFGTSMRRFESYTGYQFTFGENMPKDYDYRGILKRTYPDSDDLHEKVKEFLMDSPELIDPPDPQNQEPGKDYPSYEKWKELSDFLKGREEFSREAEGVLYQALLKDHKLGTMASLCFSKFYYCGP